LKSKKKQDAMNWSDPEARFELLRQVGVEEYGRLHAAHFRASIIEVAGGHSLRRVSGGRFGPLVGVGLSGRAFSTVEEARAYAIANPRGAP
jgi:hypothetical protein